MYSKNVGELLTKAQSEELISGHKERHSSDKDFVQFEFIGRELIEHLLLNKDVAGLRVVYGHNGTLPGIILKPVTVEGKEILVSQLAQGLKDDPDKAGAGNGPKCPTSC